MARQPEPDLEFTEEELDQTSATRPVSSMKPGKKSRGGRPLLWIFLLLLIAGIGYLAMEPEQLADWLAPFTGDNTSEPPAVATKPKTTPSSPAPPPRPRLRRPSLCRRQVCQLKLLQVLLRCHLLRSLQEWLRQHLPSPLRCLPKGKR
jgi:hypothetical protein